MAEYYPPVGFHFEVLLDMVQEVEVDNRFQSVSGLSVDIQTEDYKEGGENRFVHKLPTRTKYSDLTLQRSMQVDSQLVEWCQQAIQNHIFKPMNLHILLLDEQHLELASWHVIGAIPTSWSISDLKAQESALVIETLKLSYKYFTAYPPSNAN